MSSYIFILLPIKHLHYFTNHGCLLILWFLLSERKTLRHTTQKKSDAAKVREKEREKKVQKQKLSAERKKQIQEFRRLTQQELLEEAKITEEINLKSLGLFNTYASLELIRTHVWHNADTYAEKIVL